MANRGFLELTLLDVAAEPAVDPETLVSVFRAQDGTELVRQKHAFPGMARIEVPAFPTEHRLSCAVTPSRYHRREAGFFTLMDGESITRRLTVLRRASAWQAQFDAWTGLAADLGPLKKTLDASHDLRVKEGTRLGRFTGAKFDSVDPADRRTVVAKASLLNLFAKLNALKEPTARRRAWFYFVDELLEIDRERLIAIVDRAMLDRVRTILDNLDDFPDYKLSPAANHHKNIPDGYRADRSRMVSIKTREDQGNVQVTLAEAAAPDGRTVVLLDADIDENGKLMKHLADLFKHKITGGTHPFDVREYLVLEDRTRPLGYGLV